MIICKTRNSCFRFRSSYELQRSGTGFREYPDWPGYAFDSKKPLSLRVMAGTVHASCFVIQSVDHSAMCHPCCVPCRGCFDAVCWKQWLCSNYSLEKLGQYLKTLLRGESLQDLSVRVDIQVASQLESARGVEPPLFFSGNRVERMLGQARENPIDGITPNCQQRIYCLLDVRKGFYPCCWFNWNYCYWNPL